MRTIVCRYFIACRLLTLSPQGERSLSAEGSTVASASRWRFCSPLEHADCIAIVARGPQHAAGSVPAVPEVKFLSVADIFALSQPRFIGAFAKSAAALADCTRFACRSDGCAHFLPTDGGVGRRLWRRRKCTDNSRGLVRRQCYVRNEGTPADSCVGRRSAASEVYMRGNAAWGRKNRHRQRATPTST